MAHSESYGSNFDEIDRWEATFFHKSLPNFEVKVNSKSKETGFKLAYKSRFDNPEEVVVNIQDPFYDNDSYSCISNILIEQDKRVPIMIDAVNSLYEDDSEVYAWYKSSLLLWNMIEKQNKHYIVK